MSGTGIRPAEESDAEALAPLLAAAWPKVSPPQIAHRLAELPDDHAVFVATSGDDVIGWVHVFLDHSLIVGRRAQIGGLSVIEDYQGSGVGQALMRHAEDWAQARGCEAVYVRSGSHRRQAHRFYEKLGYEHRKRQEVLVKTLSADGR